jgi:hypothetical protein
VKSGHGGELKVMESPNGSDCCVNEKNRLALLKYAYSPENYQHLYREVSLHNARVTHLAPLTSSS